MMSAHFAEIIIAAKTAAKYNMHLVMIVLAITKKPSQNESRQEYSWRF